MSPAGWLALLPLLFAACISGPTAEERDVTDRFVLSDDVQVTLWAESPEFYNPTNIDVDARGRIWVAEAVNYRDFNHQETGHTFREGGDRIVILEDTDGNGVSDQSTVFVQDEDLHAPLGIAVIGKHVVVSTSPSVILYTDEDGDDRPDSKEVFLTGFGGYDHDHGLHSFVAGPDGQWYFNTGNAGPHLVEDASGWTLRAGSVYTGGTPYNTKNEGRMISDDGRMYVGGVALRIRPDGTGMTVLGHNFRNAYELAVDSYGNLWQSDNDDQVVTCRTTWLMESGNAGYFSADGTRYWQADHRPGQDAFTAHWHQEDPGVLPAGDNYGAGSPTGLVVYEDDAFGPEQRGMLLVGEAGRNVVFGYTTEAEGAGFRLNRSEFISSVGEWQEDYVWDDPSHHEDARKWFRPSDVAVGTDGAIYVADWYDSVVGGHQSKDTVGSGRIYRITPKGKTLTPPVLDLASTEGQIEALLSPAINVRAQGFDSLKAKGPAVLDDVRALLDRGNPYHQARAVWLLANLGPAGVEAAEALLDHADPRLRLTAFRALRQVKPGILAEARALVRDPSSAVRREVAIALRDVPLAGSLDLILALAEGYDGQDRWYLEALGTASEGKEEAVYAALKAKTSVPPERWEAPMAGLAWRLHPVSSIPDLKRRAASPRVSEAERTRALVALAFIPDEPAAEAMAGLAESPLPDVAEQAGWWLRYRNTNDWRSYPAASAGDLVAATAAPDSQMVRLRTFVADSSAPIDERVQASTVMAGDPQGGQMLLGLLSGEPGLPYQITSILQTLLLNNPDPAVRALAAARFRPDEAGEARPLPDLSGLTPDATRGRQVFTTACATCHRIQKTGGDIGPDLTFIHKKFDRHGLLDAIVNPSGAITFGYEPWMLKTHDGEVVYGFIQADGATVVVKDAAGRQRTLDADAIATREAVSTSLMPAPDALGLSDQDLADLLHFLFSLQGETSVSP